MIQKKKNTKKTPKTYLHTSYKQLITFCCAQAHTARSFLPVLQLHVNTTEVLYATQNNSFLVRAILPTLDLQLCN